MRYFITFSYNGTSYHGWQIQPNATTVQEVLEDRLSKILREKISLVAAGRTDTSVHAAKMIAHLDADLPDLDNLIYRTNAFLPADIAIQQIQAVKPNAHARFDAIERTYQYHITYQKDPFHQDTTWHWTYQPLDLDMMNQAAQTLLSENDFTSFARLHADNKTNICDVRKAEWKLIGHNLIFEIAADRFLRNMVRAVVGTLVEVGQGKISTAEFVEIIAKKDRKFASASAPAQGLFLTDVEYPEDIFI